MVVIVRKDGHLFPFEVKAAWLVAKLRVSIYRIPS